MAVKGVWQGCGGKKEKTSWLLSVLCEHRAGLDGWYRHSIEKAAHGRERFSVPEAGGVELLSKVLHGTAVLVLFVCLTNVLDDGVCVSPRVFLQ